MSSIVSVVCPLSSCAMTLTSHLERLSALLSSRYEFYEIILVDDASGDGTSRVVDTLLPKFSCVRFIELSRPSGREVAITAGLESALGDYVVVVVLGEDPLDLIPDFVSACQKGSPLVLGVSRDRKSCGLLYRLGSWLFHTYCGYLGLDLVPGSTDFRCLSRQAVDSLTRFGGKNRYVRLFLARTGFACQVIAYSPLVVLPSPGLFFSFWKSVNIVVGSSSHPLRVVSGLGLISAALSLCYVFYILGIYAFKPEVAAGWTTLSLQLSGMFFLLFLVLGVLCEYVGRVLEEVQVRPLYFVASHMESPHSLEKSIQVNVVSDPTL